MIKNRRTLRSLGIIFIVILCGIGAALGLMSGRMTPATFARESQNPQGDQTAGSSDPLPLLQITDLVYVGAFRVPNQDNSGNSLGYAGHALSYNPENHSLFFGGHDWYQQLCEIGIPPTIALTQTATVLQDCEDVTEGRLGLVDQDTIKLGGTLRHNDRLIVSAYTYYDADGDQTLSHFASDLDLSQTGDVQGPYQVGDWAGFVSGYMAPIPLEWQTALGGPALTGNCCLSIISRTSYGPAISVFDPDQVGVVEPISATHLLNYPPDHPLAAWDATGPYFNGSTNIVGVALPPGTRSVLFFGRHGIGEFCYGGPECNDPVSSYQGTHAYPYVHQVWAYDVEDLVAVLEGTLEPWEVLPYGIWRLDEMDDAGSATIAGAAFDPATGRVYITESYGETPVVHVYQINLPPSVLQPRGYLPFFGRDIP